MDAIAQTKTAALRVFISYSHDSAAHKETVMRLSARLRKDGIDAQIDQYVRGRPPEGWPRWMLDKLEAVRVRRSLGGRLEPVVTTAIRGWS